MVDGALECVRVTLGVALSFVRVPLGVALSFAHASPPPCPPVLGLKSLSLALALVIGELEMGSELNGSRIIVIALQSKKKKNQRV